MSAPTDTGSIRVIIAKDASAAQLSIAADCPRQSLNAQICLNLLQQQGLAVTPPVRHAVDAFLRQLPPQGQEANAVVATAQPAKDGTDGHVAWLLEEAAPNDAAANSKNYYAHSAYLMVKPGQVLGQVHNPTPGEDGRDIYGKTIAAKIGKPAPLQLDESIHRDSAGQLVAQREGVLTREGNKASIRHLLEVPEYVDFSTGNIDFSGDVVIRKGVRDRFVVKAGGSVEVFGPIEAATIDCRRDLDAHGGFAGRERGHAHIGGNLRAKYLDNIQGEIRGDLLADREVVNCALTIHGGIASPHAAIVGGHLTVANTVHVGTLGSDADVPTELILGTVPRLESLCRQLQTITHTLQAQNDKLLGQQKQIQDLSGRRTTSIDKEKQTEILFSLSSLRVPLARAQVALQELQTRIDAQRTVNLKIERRLHAGVILTLGLSSFRVTRDTRGPLHITGSPKGDLVFRCGDGPSQPLAQIAEVHVKAA
ncbi:MAG: DUF342 domain-containing protein [Phycisphaeraceae bacterium]|nr:DUF342 domain-containing protein [Phycisphaeraceae bacterium]